MFNEYMNDESGALAALDEAVAALGEDVRKTLVPLPANWLSEEWKGIIANERFRLTRPMQTVPAIEATLAGNRKGEALIASLLLTGGRVSSGPRIRETVERNICRRQGLNHGCPRGTALPTKPSRVHPVFSCPRTDT